MTFGEVLEALRRGSRVSRAHWPGFYLELQRDIIIMVIGIELLEWVAQSEDLLADDWTLEDEDDGC